MLVYFYLKHFRVGARMVDELTQFFDLSEMFLYKYVSKQKMPAILKVKFKMAA